MPITKSGEDNAPAWCGLSYFEVVTLAKGETRDFVRRGKREKIIVGTGTCEIRVGDEVVAGEFKTNVDLQNDSDHFAVRTLNDPATLVWMCGDWETETSSGIFQVGKSDEREDKGDAVDYAKETSFDCHYHDCDEYWLIFKGKAKILSEEKEYYVKQGDIVFTRAGDEHDVLEIYEDLEAFYFEDATPEGGRVGHLHKTKAKAKRHDVSTKPIPADFPA